MWHDEQPNTQNCAFAHNMEADSTSSPTHRTVTLHTIWKLTQRAAQHTELWLCTQYGSWLNEQPNTQNCAFAHNMEADSTSSPTHRTVPLHTIWKLTQLTSFCDFIQIFQWHQFAVRLPNTHKSFLKILHFSLNPDINLPAPLSSRCPFKLCYANNNFPWPTGDYKILSPPGQVPFFP